MHDTAVFHISSSTSRNILLILLAITLQHVWQLTIPIFRVWRFHLGLLLDIFTRVKKVELLLTVSFLPLRRLDHNFQIRALQVKARKMRTPCDDVKMVNKYQNTWRSVNQATNPVIQVKLRSINIWKKWAKMIHNMFTKFLGSVLQRNIDDT